MKHDFLIRNTPLGMSVKQELRVLFIGLGVSLLYSFSFCSRLSHAWQDLYVVRGKQRILIEGAVMPHFDTLLGHAMAGFLLTALCMVGFAIYHYAYYRQGSMSIYLLKRLPKKSERHRRALTLPCLSVALCALCALTLTLIYFAVYLLFTPKGCLPSDGWHQLWRILS